MGLQSTSSSDAPSSAPRSSSRPVRSPQARTARATAGTKGSPRTIGNLAGHRRRVRGSSRARCITRDLRQLSTNRPFSPDDYRRARPSGRRNRRKLRSPSSTRNPVVVGGRVSGVPGSVLSGLFKTPSRSLSADGTRTTSAGRRLRTARGPEPVVVGFNAWCPAWRVVQGRGTLRQAWQTR
jgi:hypothetical protein